MRELDVFSQYMMKIFSLEKLFFTAPVGLAMTFGVEFTLPSFSSLQKSMILLLIFFIADFATGIYASWVELKKAKEVVPASGVQYLIQSQKLRMSAVKFITYSLGILSAYGVEWLFVFGDFDVKVSANKMNLPTIVACIFSAIELYSIFFENLKRAGFDVLQKFKNMFKTGKEVYDTVNLKESKEE